MGTRHLIVVMMDGTHKVAQYGQWDGGPQGHGMMIRDFLRLTMDKERFKTNLRKCQFLSTKTIDDLWKKFGASDNGSIPVDKAKVFAQHYPELYRDTGAGILRLIQDSKEGLGLQDSLDFVQDSLFCEWAYVIDLDADTFEVYKGFNKEPLTPADRFYNGKFKLSKTGKSYYPVKILKKYSLNDLPDPQAFLLDFQSKDQTTPLEAFLFQSKGQTTPVKSPIMEPTTLLNPIRKINWR
jgi:hypothetical protein